MHSSSSIAALLLIASAASPAVAAPIRSTKAREFDERADIVPILKTLGTGLLGGGAVAALDHFLKPSDSSSSRRDIDELEERADILPIIKTLGTGLLGGGAVAALDHFLKPSDSASSRREYDELEARVDILPIVKTLGTGLLGGGAVAALDHFLKPADASSSRRELTELEARSVIGSLLGATEASLGNVVKTSAAAGLASGAVAGLGAEAEKLFGGSSSKRELEERLNLGPIEKGLIGTVTSLGVSGAASSLLDKVFGNNKRSLTTEEELVARSVIGSLLGATEASLGNVLKTSAAAGLASGAVAGLGAEAEKLLGGNSSKRELEERLNLGPIEKGLIGTATSLGVSGAASSLLDKVFGNNKRSLTAEEELVARSVIGSLLGATEASLGNVVKTSAAAGLASGAVAGLGAEAEKLFGGNSKRELEQRLNLGPIEKGLIGTATSLGVSGAASGLIDKIFGNRAFNDLD